MKKYNIIWLNPQDFTEVSDSIADAAEVIQIVENALADGFQFNDFLAGLQAEPKVREIINDAPVFWAQFLELDGGTALSAVRSARERLINSGQPMGKIVNGFLGALFAIANNYAFAQVSFEGGKEQLEIWKLFVDGGNLFEELPAGS